MKLADEASWRWPSNRDVQSLASALRQAVARVRKLESEASTNSVFLTAARCSYELTKRERDFAVYALEKRHFADEDANIELPNGRMIEAGTDWDNGCKRIWGLTDGPAVDCSTLLEAICAGMHATPKETP
jgi:hypothetical protein